MLFLLTAHAGPTAWIINGQPAAEHVYEMTGAILVETDRSGAPWLWCSGTLLAPDVVVLAAHCVDPMLILSAFPGTTEIHFTFSRLTSMTPYDGTGQRPYDAVDAIGAVYHAGYSHSRFELGISDNDDIALLFLGEALDVAHAYPLSSAESVQLVEGASVDVVGWGQSSTAPDSTGDKRWGTSVVGEVGGWEFHVGPEAADVRQCFGDSGGPVFLTVDASTTTATRLAGITSHAYDETGCEETGGVSTRVDAYLDWLDAQLVARCEDGFRVWCDEPGLIFAPEEDDTETSTGGGSGDSDPNPTPSTDGGGGRVVFEEPAGCQSVGGGALWWLPVLLLRRRR